MQIFSFLIFCLLFALSNSCTKGKDSNPNADKIMIYIDSSVYINSLKKVRNGPTIIGESDIMVTYDINKIENYNFHQDSFEIDLRGYNKNYIKLEVYDQEKEYIFFLENNNLKLKLKKDSFGIFLVNASDNQLIKYNWQYHLSRKGLMEQAYWNKNIPIFLRQDKFMPPDKLGYEYLKEHDYLENKIVEIKKYIQISFNDYPEEIKDLIEIELSNEILKSKKIGIQFFNIGDIKSLVDELFSTGLDQQQTLLWDILPLYFGFNLKSKAITQHLKYYDSLEKLNINDNVRDHLIAKSFVNLSESLNTEDLREIAETKIRKLIIDINLLNNVLAKMNLDQNLVEDVLLKDIKGNEITLDSFLRINVNKVIYVDLWASWCAPCIRMIPHSKKLSDDLNLDKIIVLYLAINDNFSKWKQKSVELGLEQYKNSFYIQNSKTSIFLDELKINTIPRYLIINKEGKIVEGNASSPDDKNIRKSLLMYVD